MLRLTWIAITFVLSGLMSTGYGGSEAKGEDSDPNVEVWGGWIDKESSQQRWAVRVKRDDTSIAVLSVITLDEGQTETQVKNFKIADGVWTFDWVAPSANVTVAFAGLEQASGRVIGSLKFGRELVPTFLEKTTTALNRDPATLGADQIWSDYLGDESTSTSRKENSLRSRPEKQQDFRFRIYSTPPFGEDVKPRIVFDSMKKGIIGQGVEFHLEEPNRVQFDVPSLSIVFRGALNEDNTRIVGTISRGSESTDLTLYNIFEIQKDLSAKLEGASQPKRTAGTKEHTEGTAKSQNESVRIKMEPNLAAEEAIRKSDLTYFELKSKASVPLGTQETELIIPLPDSINQSKESSLRIGGTLRLPESSETDKERQYPLVIFVSDFGLQDRDGKLGSNAPYRAWAEMFGKFDVATFRYDDRGIGSSSPTPTQYTIQSNADDLVCLIKPLRNHPRIDASRVAILGHGEGALAATLASSVEPNVSSLILIGPAGVKGLDNMLAQADRVSEIEGMSKEERQRLLLIQSELHQYGLNLSNDLNQRRKFVQQLVSKHWPELISSLKGNRTEEELSSIRLAMIEQLLNELSTLGSSWNQHYMNYDPTSVWMLIQSPTLALWGEHDVVSRPDLNLPPLKQAAARNGKLQVDWKIIHDANHWLQNSTTGAPSEYESAANEMTPQAKEAILKFVREHL